LKPTSVGSVALEHDRRNHAVLRLLYAGGMLCPKSRSLKLRDLVAGDDAGQVTIFGKEPKTRTVLPPATA